jgi:mannosyltransferase
MSHLDASMARKSESFPRVAIVLILALGFGLRVYGLNTSSLWLDEIHSFERASQETWQAVHDMLIAAGHAPAYEVGLLHFWMKLGTSDFILRFPSAVSGLLTIPIVFTLGRRVFNTKVGLLSALLLAISPLHIYYSQEMRMYSLATLWSTLGTYFYYRAFLDLALTRRWKHWILFVACGALGLYTHYVTGFALLTLGIFSLVRMAVKGRWRLLYALLSAYLVIGVLFLPWVPTLRAQLKIPHIDWIPPLTLQRLSNILIRFFINRAVVGGAYTWLTACLVFAWVVGLILFLRTRNKKEGVRGAQWTPFLFVLAGSGGPILIAVGVSLFKPFVVDRYFLIVVPLASLLMALAIVGISRCRMLLPIVAFLMVGVIVSAYGVATTEWKGDWRGVSSYIDTNAQHNDVIVLTSRSLRPSFEHYYRGLSEIHIVGRYLMDRGEIAEAFDEVDSFSRIWLVQADRFEPSTEVQRYICEVYGQDLLLCRTFGGFFGVDVCLYTNDSDHSTDH